MEKRIIAKDVCVANQLKVLKMFTISKKSFMFASTLLATHKVEQIAYQGEPYAFTGFCPQNNTPPLPLFDAHLGGFFFL